MQEEWERLLAFAEEDGWHIRDYESFQMHPLARIRGGSRESLERAALGLYYDIPAAAANILADPTGYGLESDLAIALVLRDEVLLHKALSREGLTPHPLEEHGTHLIDFVMMWHRGLQMILDRARATDINTYISSGYALERAYFVSTYLCNIGRDAHLKPCNNCSCTRSLGILLDYQGPLLVDRMQWYCHSWKAMHTVLTHIKYWREKLAVLARVELAPGDQASLGLDTDSVLDGYASRVNMLLHSRGIDSAIRLGLNYSDDRLKTSSK